MKETKIDIVDTVYKYYDLYVFKKVGKNEYVSLTDWELTNNVSYHLESSAEYLVGFALMKDDNFIISEVTLDELMLLANWKADTKVLLQISSKIDVAQSENIIAILCSQKILNCNYGSIKRIGKTLDFNFVKRVTRNGSRVYDTVMTKSFAKGK